MQNLDSTKLVIPITAIDSFDSMSFDLTQKTDRATGCYSKDYLTLRPDAVTPLGLKTVLINKISEQAYIELSAKVLREQYPLGINSNTIEQAIENISCQAVKLNASKVLDTAQVCSVDITENLPISHDVGLYTASLGAYKYLNDKWLITAYKTKGNESVVLKKRAKSKKGQGRITAYAKPGEMYRSHNKDIREFVPPEVFEHTLRIEQNIDSLERMRTKLGISDNRLDSVLNSKATPLLDTINDITKVLDKLQGVDYMEIQVLQNARTTGEETNDRRWFDKFMKLGGKRGFADKLGNDIQQIELALLAGGFSRKHVWSLKREFVEAVAVNRQQEALKQGKTGMIDNEYISELKQGLQQVYSV